MSSIHSRLKTAITADEDPSRMIRTYKSISITLAMETFMNLVSIGNTE